MKIIIVRHGETVENRKKIVQGQQHGTLTKKGINQAKRLGKRLSRYKISTIYSSDLDRANKTAQEIAKHHHLKIKYSKLLRERKFGIYEKRPRSVVEKDREKSGHPFHSWKPKGGESYVDMHKRVKKFLKKLNHKNQTIVIVSHGGMNRVFIVELKKLGVENCHKIEQDNTCVNIINVKNGKGRLSRYNCTKHLN